MSPLSWEYKITVFCGICSLVLALFLGVEWWYGARYRDQIIDDIFNAKKAGFEMQAVPNYAPSTLPIEQFRDFVERPVYFEGRRPIAKKVDPVAPVAEAPKPPTAEFDLILTGIVKTPLGIKALFQNPKAATAKDKNKRLGQGEVFNGWRVVDINAKANKVNIQADGDIKELSLLKAKPKAPVLGMINNPPGVSNNINPFARPPGMDVPPPPPPPNVPPNINPFNIKR